MKVRTLSHIGLMLAALLIVRPWAAPSPSFAQSVSYFSGKTVTIVVGYSPGGGYDLYARDLARYFGGHIPGHPSVIVQNMPGAATLLSVRHLDTDAATDGTVITMFDPGLITSSLATPDLVKIKLTDYRWIGTLARDQRVCYASVASGVKTFADLLAQKKFIMGATAKGADAYVNAAILRKIFHAPIVQVAGYPGSSEQRLAVERGELEGNCAAWASLPPDWIANHKINALVRFSARRPDTMPVTTPYVIDLAKSAEQKALIGILNAPGELARPFIVSRRVPQARVEILRRAFEATQKDPGFVADLRKQSAPLDPVTGAEAEAIVAGIYRNATPKVVNEIKDVLN